MPDITYIVDKKRLEYMFSQFRAKIKNTLRIAMLKSFQLVGNKAVQDHMVRGHVVHSKSGYTVGTAGSPMLNIMSGDLAKSLTGGFSFSGGSQGRRDSIRAINFAGNNIIGIFGSAVPYANIHEKGGTIRAKNSPYLMFKIGPFWFKKKSVKIPKRPYLNPALKESNDEIQSIFLFAVDALSTEIQIMETQK